MYFVRLAKTADAKRIARVHVAAWRLNYRGQVSDTGRSFKRRETFWLQRFEQGTGWVFVIERDGIAGFCDLIPARDKDAGAKTVGEIAALYVVSDDLRLGAGKVLYHHVLAEARKRGFKALILWVLASNSNGMRFYESLGFVRDGTTKIETASDGSNLYETRYRIKFAAAGG